MHMIARLLTAALPTVLVAGLLTTPPPAGASPPAARASATAQRVAPMSAADLTTMWAEYGNEGSGHWTGGDATVTVPLPDGRIAWLYADTFLGTVNADFSRSPDTPFINNSLVVQNGTSLGPTLHGGTADSPTALVAPPSADDFYWVADGTVEDSKLKVVYGKYTPTGEGPPLGFALTGNAIATFSLPDLKLSSVRELPVAGSIGWGSALLEEGAHTYIYGSAYTGGVKFVHVARAARGALEGPWEYWTGNGWSTQESASKPLASGISEGMSVSKIGNQYVLVTQENHEVFSSWIVGYVSASPTGPFTGPTYLHKAVEPEISEWAQFVYVGRVHPELSAPGKLLISYDVNAWDRNEHYRDARVYRPRFVEVAWPPPAPDPAKVPGTPIDLKVTAGSDGTAQLTWTAPPGANLNYWVYRKDLTSGQTHFARTHYPATETRYTDGMLKAGHSYAYQVTAIAVSGEEGSPTPATTIEGRVTAPAAPTNLKAVPGTVGDVALSWTASEPGVAHRVYRRDVTAGETLFVEDTSVDDPHATVGTVTGLRSSHAYEFKVTAVNQVGESGPSNLVTVTARFAPPGAPSNLTATALTDGSVRLAWTAPAGEVPAYWVHRRDVTAGETGFTRLDLPIAQAGTTVTSLTSGKTYEFKVVAENDGGAGPPSNVATATARLALPEAPTGVSATPQSDGSVKLTWTASARARAYWIYRRDVTFGHQTFSRFQRPAEGTGIVVDDLVNGNIYEFKVAAVGDGGEGAPGAVVTATARTAPPAAPTGLSAAAQDDGTVKLAWTPLDGAFYWVHYRDVTAGETAFTRFAYPATNASAQVGPFPAGHVLDFKVVATNSFGDGPPSDLVRVTARNVSGAASAVPTLTSTASDARGTALSQASAASLPYPPSNLKVTWASDGAVDLDWDPSPSGEVFYWVQFRSEGQASWYSMAYPTANTFAEVRGFLWNGFRYEFRVVAENGIGAGGPSNTVSVRVGPQQPQQPTNLQVFERDHEISLTWDPVFSTDMYYWVEFKSAGTGTWYRFPWPAVRNEARITSPLWAGYDYDFRVIGVNGAGESPPSAPVTGAPGLPFPQPPAQVFVENRVGQILVWWGSTSNHVYYWLYYRLAGTSSWTRARYPIAKTSVTLKYLPVGAYEIRITAVNPAGESESSHVQQAYLLPSMRQALEQLTGYGQASRDEWKTAFKDNHGIYRNYDFRWETDFCSWSVDQPFFGMDFDRVDWRPACARHDFGYRNYKRNGWFDYTIKTHLDQMFLKDMMYACDREVARKYVLQCHTLALVYFSFVRPFD